MTIYVISRTIANENLIGNDNSYYSSHTVTAALTTFSIENIFLIYVTPWNNEAR